jgi:hypothetical protein
MKRQNNNFTYLSEANQSFTCPYYQHDTGGGFCLAYGGSNFKKISPLEKKILCAESAHIFCRIYKNITNRSYRKKEVSKEYSDREKNKNNFTVMSRHKLRIKKGGILV